MRTLWQWLEHRAGVGGLLRGALYEPIPGGAKWRYVWGSTLTFAFFVQAITGIVLWSAYSPGSQNAWESVYYIQHEMQGGWMLRGIHHFMAQAMVVLLAIHMLQVIIAGAYRAPREINFWLGLILLMITLGLALSGYLLPWDQKGYWATNVATNLMTLVPGIGEDLQKLVLGGATYGHHTLTRFFAVHAGLLPAAMVGFLVLHIYLFRRHGITAKAAVDRPAGYFWPDQILRDAVACLAVLAVVLLMTIHWDVPAVLRGEIDTFSMGAELAAPAEPSESYAAARPEWYFLALFQLLKPQFGMSEFTAAIVLPGCILLFLFLMPFIGRWQLGHRFNIVFCVTLFVAASLLTLQAYRADRVAAGQGEVPQRYEDGEEQQQYEQAWQGSHDYLLARQTAHTEALRMHEIIQQRGGIPPSGAITLYRSDPVIQGPKLFRLHCAGCHSYVPPATDDSEQSNSSSELASSEVLPIVPVTQSASNLYGFGSRAWVAGILDPERIASDHYFGTTAFAEGEMVGFVNDSLSDLEEDGRANLAAVIAALSAEANLPGQAELDQQAQEDGTIEAGREAMVSEFACTDCHKFHDHGDLGLAPDLTGYASAEWLRAFIANPGHERFYGDNNDRMPAYAASAEKSTLQPHALELLVRWLRGERALIEPDSKR